MHDAWIAGTWFRLDSLTVAMLALVGLVGAVLLRFSAVYLRGEPGRARFLGWLVATLASVLTLAVANDLVLFAGAWLGTSLALHRLLTFYRERPQALVAAHKKFLVSRIADACVFAAIALVGLELNTTRIDLVHAWAERAVSFPPTVQVATVLFAIGACIKCAQLPVHGWLIQVMEAPTPVSALLHAGIINLGGFLMMRLAPLMSRSDAAQTLLVVVGSFTAVVAALAMTTRITIKVRLAWSTCAQMGFMLVECGLGAYHLALLHLLGHSLYKAHAFLSAGSTVEVARVQAATRPTAGRVTPALLALALGVLYLGGHAFAGLAAPELELEASSASGTVVAVGALAALITAIAILRMRPRGRLARGAYPALFAGLYLDEIFTRLTFRLWPPSLPPARARPPHLQVADARRV